MWPIIRVGERNPLTKPKAAPIGQSKSAGLFEPTLAINFAASINAQAPADTNNNIIYIDNTFRPNYPWEFDIGKFGIGVRTSANKEYYAWNPSPSPRPVTICVIATYDGSTSSTTPHYLFRTGTSLFGLSKSGTTNNEFRAWVRSSVTNSYTDLFANGEVSIVHITYQEINATTTDVTIYKNGINGQKTTVSGHSSWIDTNSTTIGASSFANQWPGTIYQYSLWLGICMSAAEVNLHYQDVMRSMRSIKSSTLLIPHNTIKIARPTLDLSRTASIVRN